MLGASSTYRMHYTRLSTSHTLRLCVCLMIRDSTPVPVCYRNSTQHGTYGSWRVRRSKGA